MRRAPLLIGIGLITATCADFDHADQSFCQARPDICDAGLSSPDAGRSDAGLIADAGRSVDAGGPNDAGSGTADAAVDDASVTLLDAGTSADASTPDAAVADAAVADAAVADAGEPPPPTWAYQLGGQTCTALTVTGLGANTAGVATVVGTYNGNDCDVGVNGGSLNSSQIFISRFASGVPQMTLIKAIGASPGPALTLEDGTSILTMMLPGMGPGANDIPFGPTTATTCHSGGNGNFGSDGALCMVKLRADAGVASATSLWTDLANTASTWTVFGTASGTGGTYALGAYSYGNLNMQPAGAFTVHGGSGNMLIGSGPGGFWLSSNDCAPLTSVSIDRTTNEVFASGPIALNVGTCQFIGSPSVPLTVSNGPRVIAKYSAAGLVAWAHAFAGWPLVGNGAVAGGTPASSQSAWYASSLLGTASDPLLPDGGFTSDENGSTDLILVKLFGSNGALRPGAAKLFGSPGDDSITAMQLDADGGLWMVGTFAGSGLDFGGGPLSAPDGGVFVARLDAQTLAHRESWVVPASSVPSITAVIAGGARPIAGGTFQGSLNVGTGRLNSSPPGASGWVGTLSAP